MRPLFQAFRPQLLLVSAGFDAHWNEPITGLGLSISGFLSVSKELLKLASEFCQGKAVFVLEGGYNPENVAGGADAVFSALSGSAPAPDAPGPSPYREPEIEALVSEIREWHGFT